MAHSDYSTGNDFGKLILRVSLALMMLLHGIAKIINGPDFILGLAAKAGLPSAFGYLVYVGEVVAPVLVLIGLWTRPAALVMAINMLVAVWLVHMGELFQLGKSGGWALELQGFFFFVSIAVAFLGAGRYSVGGIGGKWN